MEYDCSKFPSATEPNAKPEIGVGKLLIIFIIAPNNNYIYNILYYFIFMSIKISYIVVYA